MIIYDKKQMQLFFTNPENGICNETLDFTFKSDTLKEWSDFEDGEYNCPTTIDGAARENLLMIQNFTVKNGEVAKCDYFLKKGRTLVLRLIMGKRNTVVQHKGYKKGKLVMVGRELREALEFLKDSVKN